MGQFYRPDAVALARRGLPPDGAAAALLIPDPGNPHDPHALAVRVNGQHVGWLSRHITPVMQPAVNAFAASCGGRLVSCPARLTDGTFGTRILLYLDLAPLGVDPAAIEYVPELDQVVQWLLPRLAVPVPALPGRDDAGRRALAAAEADRCAVDEDYSRSPGDWPRVERAFRQAAARLEAARDPLVSQAWLGVARATRYQRGRRDHFLVAAVEALRWDPGNAPAWTELIGMASAAPHVPTLVALFARIPVTVRPQVLRHLITLSRGHDRLGNMSPAEGARAFAPNCSHSQGQRATRPPSRDSGSAHDV